MGVYYKIVNLDKGEYIAPDKHGRWERKRHAFIADEHPAMKLLAVALLGRWNGDRIRMAADVGRDDSLYYNEGGTLRDVTLELLAELAKWWPKHWPNLAGPLWDGDANNILTAVSNRTDGGEKPK